MASSRRRARIAAGKPEKGTIRLSAYHEGGHIIIGVADDGRGLDTEQIKAKALASGLATEAELEKMSEAQIQKFIFTPGFSTAAKVTSVSGRGVGMDVVRNNIDQIGGTIDVQSVRGQGLTFTIKIPLTLAIISALIVEAAASASLFRSSRWSSWCACTPSPSTASSGSRTRPCCACATSCCRWCASAACCAWCGDQAIRTRASSW